MTRTEFLKAVARDGLELAVLYAACCGVSLTLTQLWLRSAP